MILQAVPFCYSPNDFTGIANGNTVCRYIFGYYTPGSNYAIIADGYPGHMVTLAPIQTHFPIVTGWA